MNYILFDSPSRRKSLLPFTYTRAVADIRFGIMTLREKWGKWLDEPGIKVHAASYLQELYGGFETADNVYINAAFSPDSDLVDAIGNLQKEEGLSTGDEIIAFRSDGKPGNIEGYSMSGLNVSFRSYDKDCLSIKHAWDIFSHNDRAIASDYEMIAGNRDAAKPGEGVAVTGDRLFVEEGAEINHAVINTETGPVYIGKNARIMEGALIRGPFALCEGSVLKMGAKIYGATTIGPYSKVGGEVNNSVIIGYSNKAHDGFIGNSVIGEWCNIGADTNCSNLKNNYGNVRVWSYEKEDYIDSGRQFCGLMMGDHSKCGINTMFNTGTTVGVGANVFNAGFPVKFIPSFAWGGAEGWETYRFEKALEVAAAVKKRRQKELTETDRKIMREIFGISRNFRHF